MNRIFTLSLMLCLFSVLQAQNGLERIIVERYYISDVNDASVNGLGGVLPPGSVTYRFYADMLPGYTFQAGYGVDSVPMGPSVGDHELRIETTTLFFNNEDRGETTPTFTFNRLDDNTVMLDSWLSVGAACSGYYGVQKEDDDGMGTVSNSDGVLQNNDTCAGIPLTMEDGVLQGNPQTVTVVGLSNEIAVFGDQNDGSNGPLFSSSNGSWACLGGCMGPDSMENVLLIAQVTTDGLLSYEFNLQIGTPTGGVQKFVAKNPVSNEIVIPTLMGSLDGSCGGNSLPTVSITSPADQSNFAEGTALTIEASASDMDGTVDSVEFFVDGNKIGTDATAPYEWMWTVPAGMTSLTARATDDMGGQTTSSPVIVNGAVGIEEISGVEIGFGLYPNPTSGILQLTIENPGNAKTASYRLLTVHGQSILQKNFSPLTVHREQIDIAPLAKGTYILEVTVDDIRSYKKVIKN